MIQRIQTIWLLLASACAFLTYKFSFYTGDKIIDNKLQRVILNASADMLLTVLTGILGLGIFITIFLFKKRKVQFRITIAALLLSILNIVIYFTRIKEFTAGTISLTCVFIFAIPILLAFAARGIWKDEKLVRSLDRLR